MQTEPIDYVETEISLEDETPIPTTTATITYYETTADYGCFDDPINSYPES